MSGLTTPGPKVARPWVHGAPSPRSQARGCFAKAGYDYVCIDCQHGWIGYESMVWILRAPSGMHASPIVRGPSNDPAEIGRALDAGAEAVVVPLVNSAAEAANAMSARPTSRCLSACPCRIYTGTPTMS